MTTQRNLPIVVSDSIACSVASKNIPLTIFINNIHFFILLSLDEALLTIILSTIIE